MKLPFLATLLSFLCLPLVADNASAPLAIAPVGDGESMAVISHKAKKLQIVSEAGEIAGELALPQAPTSIVVAGNRAYITCGEAVGELLVADWVEKKILQRYALGHSPEAPLLVGDKLYLCLRHEGQVLELDLASGRVLRQFKVGREPLALVERGGLLWVAHHLPEGRANAEHVASKISRIHLKNGKVESFQLANGSQSLRDIALSPDGRFVIVPHLLSRYEVPTSQVDRGWINTNAITLIEAAEPSKQYPILLDDGDMGAANPWKLSFSPDGEQLLVLHAGSQELSRIEWKRLVEKVQASSAAGEDTDTLSYITQLRERIELPLNGARCLAISPSGKAWLAGYYSGKLLSFDLLRPLTAQDFVEIKLAPDEELSDEFLGERAFHDASLCMQKWQSCISCHPDTRVDALNWDMLNDGLGNPKNTRSMFLSHQLPPVMTLGVRKNAELAVRAGFRHIQFTTPDEEICTQVDKYLAAMRASPSPCLDASRPEQVQSTEQSCLQCHDPATQRGSLTPKAQRGKEIFKSAGCIDCHPHPYYTNKAMVDVGTLTDLDEGKLLQVPTLMEVWRTAPYFHDGRAATLDEAIRHHNPKDRRGKTSTLSEEDLQSLIEYVQSL